MEVWGLEQPGCLGVVPVVRGRQPEGGSPKRVSLHQLVSLSAVRSNTNYVATMATSV